MNFRQLEERDVPTVAEWLTRPHVAEWWGDAADFEEDYAPVIAGDSPTKAFIASAGIEPVGFIQSYRATDCHDEGWWLDERDPGVHGIDQFLADGARLGQGLGTAMISAFVARLFRDPAVTRVQTDPSPLNARAIRCYEKCGFRRHGEIVTLDGPASLLYCERPSRPIG
jgi:RimJ/RimL family protein N-acetyltransferase